MRSPVEGEIIGSNPICSARVLGWFVTEQIQITTGLAPSIIYGPSAERTHLLHGSGERFESSAGYQFVPVTGKDTERVSTALHAGSTPVGDSKFLDSLPSGRRHPALNRKTKVRRRFKSCRVHQVSGSWRNVTAYLAFNQ